MERGRAGIRGLAAVLAVLIGCTMVAPAGTRAATSSTITLTDCSGSGGGLQVLELWQAIIDANDESLYPGPTTIELVPNCAYYYFQGPYPGTNYALPPITSAITIHGNGAFLSTGPYSGGSYNVGGIFDVRAGASLIATNMTLFDDFGLGYLGGAYVTNAGTATLDHVSLGGYVDGVPGPAFANREGGTFVFEDSTLHDYRSAGTAGTDGAVIDNDGSFYAINADFIDNNTVPYHSIIPQIPLHPSIVNRGTMDLVDSSVHVTGTHDINEGLFGRGIMNVGTLILQGSEVSGHFYPVSGAGIENHGTLDLEASTVDDNESFGAGFEGGGIFNAGTIKTVNSVISGNVAEKGADIYNVFQGTLSYSDIGVVENDPFAQLTATGSILFSCTGDIHDGGFNLSVNGDCPGTYGYDLLSQWSHVTDIRGVVLEPLPGSAALDAGGTSCPATDQRGFPRPAGAACDIGAYENQPPTAPTNLSLVAGANPGNTGNLTLSWGASTDADFDPITYDLWGRTAGADKETELYSGTSTSVDLTGLSEGTWSFRVAATDRRALSPSATLSSVVVDRTPPSVPTATPDRAPDFTGPGGTGWYRDSVSVSFVGATDPLLADGSAPSGVALVTPTQTFTTSGPHTATGTATDAAGNVSAPASTTVNVDADPPAIAFDSCPSSVILGQATSLSWSASDAESGLATPSSGTVAVDTSTVGTRTLAATAVDNVGHVTTATCAVNVIFDFSGFAAPVANAPSLNRARAGMSIPIRFSLAGDQGLAIFPEGYPASSPITCGSDEQLTTGDPTAAAYSLVYSGGTYTYLWQTDPSWSGTCRQLIVKLSDGTYHVADFTFK